MRQACVAVDAFVRSGMAVGLGTGSTSEFVVRRLAERIAAGEIRDVTCASTSEATSSLVRPRGEAAAPLSALSCKAVSEGWSIDRERERVVCQRESWMRAPLAGVWSWPRSSPP